MSDFWNLSDGEDAAQNATGEHDAGGGNMEPIPAETSVLAAIDEAKWDKNQKGEQFISLRWSVLRPDEFENRKIFQKLWVTDVETDNNGNPRAKDPVKKRDKAKKMLAAIDTNAGGKLLAKPVMPTDEAMTLHLTNKPMVIKAMVWNMKDSVTGEMARGNWVGAVAPKSSPISSPEQIERAKDEQSRAHNNTATQAAKNSRQIDDEIPF